LDDVNDSFWNRIFLGFISVTQAELSIVKFSGLRCQRSLVWPANRPYFMKSIKIYESPQIPLEYLCVPEHYRDSLESILIPHGFIIDR
jgi:hypothetical protein